MLRESAFCGEGCSGSEVCEHDALDWPCSETTTGRKQVICMNWLFSNMNMQSVTSATGVSVNELLVGAGGGSLCWGGSLSSEASDWMPETPPPPVSSTGCPHKALGCIAVYFKE